MNTIRATFLLAFICVFAFGQTKEFEVASIKPATGQLEGANVGLHIDGAQVHSTYLSLTDYIAIAYRVKNYQIKGPDWLASQRFDIAAKLPEGSSSADVPAMLQSLLATRFQLKMHHESQDFPVYAIEVAKGGLKMTPSVASVEADDKGAVNVAASGGAGGVGFDLGKGSALTFADNKLQGTKVSMTQLADGLGRFEDRPVINRTNLSGGYDFILEISPADYRAMLVRAGLNAGVALPPQALRALDFSTGDSLRDALEKLGLQLESRKAPLDTLVIDNITKMPVDN